MRAEMITQDGRERVVMDTDDYKTLVDARDHAVAMRNVAGGAPVPTDAELDAYLAAAALAFWRQRAGRTQADLAAEVGVSQPIRAQIEGGKQAGGVQVLVRSARALGGAGG